MIKLMNLIKEEKDEDISTIEIKTRDVDGNLIKLISYIAENGNGGHSFEIIVDPETSEYKKEFCFDGDGPDYIKEITKDGKKVTWADYDKDNK